jgi:hypothetical protein
MTDLGSELRVTQLLVDDVGVFTDLALECGERDFQRDFTHNNPAFFMVSRRTRG